MIASIAMQALRGVCTRLGSFAHAPEHLGIKMVYRPIHAGDPAPICQLPSVPGIRRASSTAALEIGSQLSYVHGGCRHTLLGQTIGDNFSMMAATFPDNLAVTSMHQQSRQSYAELHAAVTVLAQSLLSLGVGPGDGVAIYSANNMEWITTMYAAATIGAILVPLNPSYKSLELAHTLLHSKTTMLITAASCRSVDMLQTVHTALQHTSSSAKCEKMLKHVVTLDHADKGADKPPPHPQMVLQPNAVVQHHSWADLMAAAAHTTEAEVAEVSARVQFDDAAQIQYTSGTTGRPKGVVLSHHSLLNNGYFIGQANNYTEQDRVCLPVPLFHCFGCVLGALAITTHGASMVFPGEAFDAGQSLQAVQQEQCTALYGVPTMFIAQLAHPHFASFDLGSLRKGIMAGSPCPQDVMQKVIDKMHMTEVTICYGMTETSPVSFQSSPQDSLQLRVSTIGKVHPHVEAKIIDPATGQIVPRGQTGELCTRGYSVMLGYWEDAAATEKVIDKARWMHTGDLAVLDAQGYCKIVGRLKDIIIRGGENISPREIEEVIHQHASVMDVQVVGVRDNKYGEEVCAWVRLHPQSLSTAGQLQQWCKGRIAAFKIPRYWRFVDSYPMTASGKVQKYLMRDSKLCEAMDCGKVYDTPNSGQVSFY